MTDNAPHPLRPAASRGDSCRLAPRTFWTRLGPSEVTLDGAPGHGVVAIMGFCAIFAFIANTTAAAEGRWQVVKPGCPAPHPWTASCPAVLAAVLPVPEASLRAKALALLAWTAWSRSWPELRRPPQAVVWDEYRSLARAGRVQSALYAPIHYSPDDRQRDLADARLQPPTPGHPLGSTFNGADLAANMIYGTRIALSIGFIATGIAVTIGVTVGGLMGYFGGLVDLLGMRVVEVF